MTNWPLSANFSKIKTFWKKKDSTMFNCNLRVCTHCKNWRVRKGGGGGLVKLTHFVSGKSLLWKKDEFTRGMFSLSTNLASYWPLDQLLGIRRVNLFKSAVVCHIETTHWIGSANKLTVFSLHCDTGWSRLKRTLIWKH